MKDIVYSFVDICTSFLNESQNKGKTANIQNFWLISIELQELLISRGNGIGRPSQTTSAHQCYSVSVGRTLRAFIFKYRILDTICSQFNKFSFGLHPRSHRRLACIYILKAHIWIRCYAWEYTKNQETRSILDYFCFLLTFTDRKRIIPEYSHSFWDTLTRRLAI